MPNKTKVFRILRITILLLVVILVAINAIYIKAACSARRCIIVNVFTILLLLWATAFWLVVSKYSKDK